MNINNLKNDKSEKGKSEKGQFYKRNLKNVNSEKEEVQGRL